MAEWTTATARLTRQLDFEGAWPSAIAFVDNDRLIAGNLDGQLLMWDLRGEPIELDEAQKKAAGRQERQPNLRPVRAYVGHTNSIARLLTADGGQTLVSASFDGTIRLWPVDAPSTGETAVVVDGELRKALTRYDKSREKEILEAPGVTVTTHAPRQTLAGHSTWVTALALSGDGRRLVSGDDDGHVIVWDFANRRELTRWKGHKMNGICSTAVTADGTKAFVAEHRFRRGDFDRPPAQAKLHALDAGELLFDLLVVKFPDVKERDNSYGYGVTWVPWVGNGFVASEFSPNGKLLAVGMGGEIDTGKVHVIDVETGKELRTISGHQYGVTDLRFTADGQHLLTVGRDTTARLCRVEDGAEVAVLGTPRGGQFKDWLSAVAISPDQTRIAATDIGGLIQVWEARSN